MRVFVFFFLSFSIRLRLCLLVLLTCFSSSVKSRRNIKIKTTMNHLLCQRFKPRICALISFFLQGQLMTRHFFLKKYQSARQTIFYVLSKVGIKCPSYRFFSPPFFSSSLYLVHSFCLTKRKDEARNRTKTCYLISSCPTHFSGGTGL